MTIAGFIYGMLIILGAASLTMAITQLFPVDKE